MINAEHLFLENVTDSRTSNASSSFEFHVIYIIFEYQIVKKCKVGYVK